jgi:hypothetical protein
MLRDENMLNTHATHNCITTKIKHKGQHEAYIFLVSVTNIYNCEIFSAVSHIHIALYH